MRVDIEMKCPFCGAEHSVEVKLVEFENWFNGELIQKAMPNLTATEREQLVSHICPPCQTNVFEEE